MTDEADRPSVSLVNRQGLSVPEDSLRELARKVLVGEGVEDAELSVALVDAGEMTELHERYLGLPGPTDVMAFPQDDEGGPHGPRLLGDVVICPGVAATQNPDLQAEVGLLLVHGILHLLGYDHEEEEERAVMWQRQEAYSGVRAT